MTNTSPAGDSLHNESDKSQSHSSEATTVQKKSILITSEDKDNKRGSSKATIQWEQSVKGRRHLEEKMRMDKKNKFHWLSIFMSHGSKWSYIQEVITKLKAEELRLATKSSEEDSQGIMSPQAMDSFVRELWVGMLQKVEDKGVDLTLDQQAKLEILKYKVKRENDKYIKAHPELDILLSLVYRKLLKTRPDNPKLFVADYVHYLNTHREELLLDEVDIPFDRPPPKEEEPVKGVVDERQEIEMFVNELVQEYVEIASQGPAYLNVNKILNSILKTVSPSVDEISSLSLDGTEGAVRGILTSMLTSVACARTKSAEIVADEVLDTLLENVCPSLSRDSGVFIELRESVENFVRSLLKTLIEKVAKQIRMRARLDRFEKSFSGETIPRRDEQDTLSVTSKSILKKMTSVQHLNVLSKEQSSDKPELKSKVKFKSISMPPELLKSVSGEVYK